MATLTFTTTVPQMTVPATHTEVAGEVVLVMGGLSPKTMVNCCEVRISTLGNYVPQKGHKCTLLLNPTAVPTRLQIWSVNTLPGGEIYRFILADENYSA